MSLLKLFNNLNSLIANKSKLINLKYLLEEYNDIDWKKYIKINDKKYNRHIVYKNENLELLIITWNKNQFTKIHDHPKNGCLFKILDGYIYEYRYNNLNDIKFNDIKMYKKNDISYIDNSLGFHKMINDEDICVSLHIYSPPFN